MEYPHQEIQGSGSMGVVDSLKKWSHDHLTLKGREDAIFLQKYSSVVEHLPKDASENQLALVELQLRQKAHSAAVGSIVVDALVTGGALVGAGVLMKKIDFNMPRFERRLKTVPQKTQAAERVIAKHATQTTPEPKGLTLRSIAENVSRVLSGHGEDLDPKKLRDVHWTKPVDWIEAGVAKVESGVMNAGKGLGRLAGWLDGALGNLADKMSP